MQFYDRIRTELDELKSLDRYRVRFCTPERVFGMKMK